MTIDDLKQNAGRRIVLVNPPVAVVDPVQLYFYADSFPLGLHQIRRWLASMGHEVELADMMGYGKHEKSFDEMLESGELAPLPRMPAGAPETDFAVWRYGQGVGWLESWFAGRDSPDEVWVSCSILFNAFLAHEVIRWVRKRFPEALVRFGGGYPTLLPEDAASSGAHDIVQGRIYEADAMQPSLEGIAHPLHYVSFRLTTGCPNRCAFCINGRDRMVRHDADEVVDFIQRTRETLGIKYFNNWDPNVLRFKPHLKKFLRELASRELDVRIRFDMGLEPPLLDDELLDLLAVSGVDAFTLPFETSDPVFARLFNKPYTIISSIRAAVRMRERNLSIRECHGTYVIGCPDEEFADLFATYHVTHRFGLRSTPFPLLVIPGSPIFQRYSALLKGKPSSCYNGHLFPLIQDKERLGRYRMMLGILSANDDRSKSQIAARLPEDLREAYGRGRVRGERLVEQVLDTDEEDSLDLLERLHNKVQ